MKPIFLAASAGLLLTAISLPVYAQMADRHISDDAEYRQAEFLKKHASSRPDVSRPAYLSAPRDISDDAEYRQAESAKRHASTRPDVTRARQSAYLLAPRHISDDAEYRQAQAFK